MTDDATEAQRPSCRFKAAGPWPGGQFYVWDSHRSSICNPDSGKSNSPWRTLPTMEEAEKAAGALNELEGNYAMQALMYAARVARESEDQLT